jgi:hypothetical protein
VEKVFTYVNRHSYGRGHSIRHRCGYGVRGPRDFRDVANCAERCGERAATGQSEIHRNTGARDANTGAGVHRLPWLAHKSRLLARARQLGLAFYRSCEPVLASRASGRLWCGLFGLNVSSWVT